MSVRPFLLPLIILAICFCSCKNESKNKTITIEQSKPKIIENEQKLDTPVDTLKYSVTNGNIGVGNYDLVNYFINNKGELGLTEFSATHNGLEYFFKSDEHKNLFIQNPEKYLPAFGGWCSMTLAMGRATAPTYTNFLIINDTLYLFEKTLSVNGRTLWQTNPDENKKQASNNYADYKNNGTIGL
jgi:YHS domain-containing protein